MRKSPKTCPVALKKIQEHFALVGLTINITPIEQFSNPNGWFGPRGLLPEEYSIKRPDRYVLEASDEVAIGFLIHEAMHTLLARPAWDHTLSGCTYNWTTKGTIAKEEYPIIIYSRHLIQTLDIQEAATSSAAEWDEDSVVEWKQPGGDLMSHDSLGKPCAKTLEQMINILELYGVTDKCGRLIGLFNPNMSNNTIKKLKNILNEEDVLGLSPQIGSPADITTYKKAA